MALGHERLGVYRLAIGYVAWVYEKAAALEGSHRAARDQWLRASQSIPLNIAEGNGKAADADRRRYFEIARGSALECAAMQDVLVVGKALDEAESQKRKTELDRMAAMLSRLGGRGYQVRESEEAYAAGEEEVDTDPDSDSDLDETKAQNGAIHWIGVLDGNDPGGGSVPFIHDDVLPPDTSIGVHTHGNDREYNYVEWGAIMPRCALPLNRDKWRGASGNAGSNAARWPVVYAQHGCAGEPDRGDPGAECGARRNGRAYPGDGDGVPGGRRRRLAGWKDHVGLQLARAPVRGPEDRAIRDYAKACHKRYGDDVTFIPGAFFSNAYNSREPINQKQTRPQDNPVPLDALAEADRQLIGRYYPDLEP